MYFISEGLLTLPILYASRYIIRHKADYYRLLREITKTDAWEAWILFMLKGVEETVPKIGAIRKLQAHTAEHVRKTAPKIYSHELVDVIFELPYCRIQNLTQRQLAGRQTASVYLKELVKAAILQGKSGRPRKTFHSSQLMQLLTRDSNELPPTGKPSRKTIRMLIRSDRSGSGWFLAAGSLIADRGRDAGLGAAPFSVAAHSERIGRHHQEP